MITKYLTSVSTRFNPFLPISKTPRSFLALLPANARSTMKIDTTLLPQTSQEKPKLAITLKNGEKIDFNLETWKIKDVVAEVDRHSRMIARKEDLSNG